MTEEKKAQIRADLHSGAAKVAKSANAKAAAAHGWRRWLYVAAAVIAGAVAWFTSGCTVRYTQSAAGDIAAKVTIIEPEEWRK